MKLDKFVEVSHLVELNEDEKEISGGSIIGAIAVGVACGVIYEIADAASERKTGRSIQDNIVYGIGKSTKKIGKSLTKFGSWLSK